MNVTICNIFLGDKTAIVFHRKNGLLAAIYCMRKYLKKALVKMRLKRQGAIENEAPSKNNF